jgi:hypothetical protein
LSETSWDIRHLAHAYNRVSERFMGTTRAIGYIASSRADLDHYTYKLLEPRQRFSDPALAIPNVLFNGCPFYAAEGIPPGVFLFQDRQGLVMAWRDED